jgi:uncharacterized GH25 family protein
MHQFIIKRYLLILVGLISSIADGHEFWIQPTSMHFTPGELLTIQLMHGERFHGDPVPVNLSQIQRYELLYHSDETDRVRALDMSEISYTRPRAAGVVVYESKHYTNLLHAEHFEAYLHEEQLHHIVDERVQRDESHLPGREIYSRCAKSILLPNNDSKKSDDVDFEVGLPLEVVIQDIELITESSNTAERAVHAKILFRGKPIQSIRAVAVDAADPTTLVELETDENGQIMFSTTVASQWMITALHIERIDNEDADWESFWSSLTLIVD